MINKKFTSFVWGEGATGGGQVVQFTCPPENKDKVLGLLAEVRSINIPSAHRVNVGHGGYGRYSRFDITQRKYAGGGSGYIEVLEIKNPPDDRRGAVIYDRPSSMASSFSEWDSVENAVAAWESLWGGDGREKEAETLPGFVRMVPCGALTPWFYAVGDQALIGDYAFPENLQADPVYQFGRKFVVAEGLSEPPRIKTCMGGLTLEAREDAHPCQPRLNRVVFWSDGTIWDSSWSSSPPRPLRDDELWIDEAIQKFQKLLSGGAVNFDIPFMNGDKFVGRLARSKDSNHMAEGRYLATVYIEGEKKPRAGWLDFKPSPETPDVLTFLDTNFEKQGKRVLKVEIRDAKATPKGKKWAGVFYGRSVDAPSENDPPEQ